MSEAKEYLSVGPSFPVPLRSIGWVLRKGGRSWSLEFDPQTGRPTEALWQHQTLRVCGQCRDCKWGVEEDDDTGHRRCHPGADSPTRCFRWPSTFGCVHWEAKE